MAPYALSAASGRRSTSIGDLELASPGSRSAACDANHDTFCCNHHHTTSLQLHGRVAVPAKGRLDLSEQRAT